MLKDLASQKKSDRDVILAAITSLKAKGWHINPYTVADEAMVSRSIVVRNAEYMDMVSKARGKAVATPNQVSDELMRQLDLMEEENRGLKDRLAQLTQQHEAMAQSINTAWQQGYEAAKAEQTVASGLQSIVRGSTTDSITNHQGNEFTNHPAQAQFYTPQNFDQGGGYDQSASFQHQPFHQEHGNEPTAEYQKAVNQTNSAEYQQQYGEAPVEYNQSAEMQGEYDDTFDPQNVETAEHEVYIASHIPELQEEAGIDAFSAQLLATLSIEGEGEGEPQEGIDGPRYDSGEFAETDIPDWDALAGVQEETGWLEPQHDQMGFAQGAPPPMPSTMMEEQHPDLSALGTSIPPAPQPQPTVQAQTTAGAPPQKGKFTVDDLHQLVTHKLEGTGTGAHEEVQPEVAHTTAPHVPPTPSNKFVGANRQGEAPISSAPVSRMVPPEIRKACLILGIKSDEITRENVNKAWKSEMAKPGVHPDTGGDTEIAIYINNAKESLMKWLEMQAPKLGKKFGGGSHGGTGSGGGPGFGPGGGKPK